MGQENGAFSEGLGKFEIQLAPEMHRVGNPRDWMKSIVFDRSLAGFIGQRIAQKYRAGHLPDAFAPSESRV